MSKLVPVSRNYDKPNVVYTQEHEYTPILGTPPSNWSEEEIARVTRGVYHALKYESFPPKKRSTRPPSRAWKAEHGGRTPFVTAFLEPLPYTRFDSETRSPPGTYSGKYDSPSKKYWYKTNFNLAHNDIPMSEAAARQELGRMLGDSFNLIALEQEALANVLPSLDIATSLAEAERTADMVLNVRQRVKRLSRQIGRALQHARKARHMLLKHKPAEMLRAVDLAKELASDLYLEYTFGWQQALRDLEAAHELYLMPVKEYFTARAKVEEAEEEVISSTFDGYYVSYDKVTDVTRRASARASATAQFEGGTANYVANPLITAYELIPFSWIFDYFVSMGDALSSWSVLAQATRVSTSVGFLYEEKQKSRIENVRKGYGTYASTPHASATADANCTLKQRSPMGGATRANHVHLPQIRVKLSTRRILNIAAVLGQRITMPN